MLRGSLLLENAECQREGVVGTGPRKAKDTHSGSRLWSTEVRASWASLGQPEQVYGLVNRRKLARNRRLAFAA
jgi:hypothetical protein